MAVQRVQFEVAHLVAPLVHNLVVWSVVLMVASEVGMLDLVKVRISVAGMVAD
jgi:hypothetical protein